MSPLHLGKRKSRGETSIEAKNVANTTPLHIAAVMGHPAIGKGLLAVEADCRAISTRRELRLENQQ
jgi:hypothetical protein